MMKKVMKMIMNKKMLIILTVIAISVIIGFCVNKITNNNIVVEQDVDTEERTDMEKEIEQVVMDLTPSKVSGETKDLGQAPIAEPEAVDTTMETFASL